MTEEPHGFVPTEEQQSGIEDDAEGFASKVTRGLRSARALGAYDRHVFTWWEDEQCDVLIVFIHYPYPPRDDDYQVATDVIYEVMQSYG